MELKFKPRTIADLEARHGGIAFNALLQRGSIGICRDFIAAGLGTEDLNLVDKEIDLFLRDGEKTFDDLFLLIIKRLEDGHFLPRGAHLMAQAEVAKVQMMSEPLASDGETVSPQQ